MKSHILIIPILGVLASCTEPADSEDDPRDTEPAARGIEGRWLAAELELDFDTTDGMDSVVENVDGTFSVSDGRGEMDLSFTHRDGAGATQTGMSLILAGDVEEDGSDAWTYAGEGTLRIAGVPPDAHPAVDLVLACTIERDQPDPAEVLDAIDILTCDGPYASSGSLLVELWD